MPNRKLASGSFFHVADEHRRGRDDGSGWTDGVFSSYSMIIGACKRTIEARVLFVNAPRSLVSQHRHQTPLRGTKAIPRPVLGQADYTDVNYRYAGQTGHIHEVVNIGGKQLAKVGFDDRKIVYYLLDDLELDNTAKKETFHDKP